MLKRSLVVGALLFASWPMAFADEAEQRQLSDYTPQQIATAENHFLYPHLGDADAIAIGQVEVTADIEESDPPSYEIIIKTTAKKVLTGDIEEGQEVLLERSIQGDRGEGILEYYKKKEGECVLTFAQKEDGEFRVLLIEPMDEETERATHIAILKEGLHKSRGLRRVEADLTKHPWHNAIKNASGAALVRIDPDGKTGWKQGTITRSCLVLANLKGKYELNKPLEVRLLNQAAGKIDDDWQSFVIVYSGLGDEAVVSDVHETDEALLFVASELCSKSFADLTKKANIDK